MKEVTEENKQDILRKILEVIKDQDLKAEHIADLTDLSAFGIRKIIKGETKNPNLRTVAQLYKAIFDTTNEVLSTSLLNEFTPSYNKLPESTLELMEKLEQLRLLLEVKEEQLKDKEEIIALLKEKLAIKSGSKENDKHPNTRTI